MSRLRSLQSRICREWWLYKTTARRQHSWWKISSPNQTPQMPRTASGEFSSALKLSSSLLLREASLRRAKVASCSPRRRTLDFRGSTSTTSSSTPLQRSLRPKFFQKSKWCSKRATATKSLNNHIAISMGLCSSNCSLMIRSFMKALAAWMSRVVRWRRCAIQPIKGPKRSLKPWGSV